MELGKPRIPHGHDEDDAGSPEAFCRAIEAYLCRKNDGHLVRIVGPSFEKVCGWASRGVPIKVAFRGIDRYFERYYAKGPRRRPVRVDFCEADVLDVFDEWRRAVGVSASAVASPGEGGDASVTAAAEGSASGQGASNRRHESLPAHIDRVVARLTALRAGADRGLDDVVDAIVRELDAARAGAKALRGGERAEFLGRLSMLDAQLLDSARARLTDAGRAALRRDAEAELAPFRSRMPQAAFEQSLAACMDRLLREQLRLPTISLQ